MTDKVFGIPVTTGLSQKWGLLWRRALRGDPSANATVKWIAEEKYKGRNFNDPKQFNIDEWLDE